MQKNEATLAWNFPNFDKYTDPLKFDVSGAIVLIVFCPKL